MINLIDQVVFFAINVTKVKVMFRSFLIERKYFFSAESVLQLSKK